MNARNLLWSNAVICSRRGLRPGLLALGGTGLSG